MSHLNLNIDTTSIDITRRFNFSKNKAEARYLDLYLRKSTTRPNPRAAIIFIHSGSWKAGSPQQFDHWAKYFAYQHNFISASVDYRLSGEAIFPAALEDVKGAIRWIRSQHQALMVDINKIILIGASAGAHLGAMALTTPGQYYGQSGANEYESDSNLAILINGEYDIWDLIAKERLIDTLQQFTGANHLFQPHIYDLISPIKHINSQLPPTLLLHGDQDHIVPYQQSLDFHKQQQNAGNISEIEIFSGKGHNWFMEEPAHSHTLTRIETFIFKYLFQKIS